MDRACAMPTLTRSLSISRSNSANTASMRAENAQLKSKDKGGLTLKVSEKGGVSLYGMGRFPVTLYKETKAPHPGKCAGDRGIHPRKRLQAENEGIGCEERGPDRNLLSLRK